MWATLVDLVRATIFVTAHVIGGSVGGAVILVTTGVRLALLPLSLRAARQARAQQGRIDALRPELARLQARYKTSPWTLYVETQELYRRHGIQAPGRAGFASALIQLPLFGALYTAVRSGLGAGARFLWIDNLSRGNLLLLVIVSAASGLAASVAPATPGATQAARLVPFLAAGATLFFLWSASSTLVLSIGAASAVSALQNWLLRRETRLAASTGGKTLRV